MNEPEVIWHAPAYDPSGYATCARDYIFALHRLGVKIRYEPVRFWSPISVAAVSGKEMQILKSLETVQVSKSAPKVHHTVPDCYRRSMDKDRPNIGYTVFETDKVPPAWIPIMNNMAQIWVPCRFNLDTFKNGGFDSSKMRSIPHIVDTDRFDPSKYKPIRIPHKREFYFLTVMDVTYRKGWDILIRAYTREFKGNRDVCLIFKGYFGGVTEQHKSNLYNRLCAFRNSLGVKNAPDMLFHGDILDLNELPRLYKAADCYVSSSRGEGWGLCGEFGVSVDTNLGVVPLGEVVVGNMVRTRDGYRKVLDTTKRTVDLLYRVKPMGCEPLGVTREHPWFTKKRKFKCVQVMRKRIDEIMPEWVRSIDIEKGDYVAVPIPDLPKSIGNSVIDLALMDSGIEFDMHHVWYKFGYSRDVDWSYTKIISRYGTTRKIAENAVRFILGKRKMMSAASTEIHGRLLNDGFVPNEPLKYNRFIHVDEDMAYLIGWYIAEGHTESVGQIELSLGYGDSGHVSRIKDIIFRKFGVVPSERERPKKHVIKIDWQCKPFAKWLDANCGKGASNKRIPSCLMAICQETWSMLKGLFLGDGCGKAVGCYSLSSLSRTLTYQVRNILMANQIYSSVTIDSRNGGMVLSIFGRFLDSFSALSGLLVKRKGIFRKRNETVFWDDKFFWVPIRSVAEERKTVEVYDICVDGCHEFIGNGVLLHNTMSEAMSMEVPTIGTGWGGNTEFMNQSNSYLIDVLEFRDTGEELTKITPNYIGQKFAKPSEEHLRRLMRYVYEHQKEAKAKAKKARQDLITNFSWRPIGEKIVNILKEEF